MPLAAFEPAGMGMPATLYNLMLMGQDGVLSYMPATLLVLMALSEVLLIVAVMGYRNRRAQMRTCAWAMAMQVLWLVNYAGYALWLVKDATFSPEFAACLPVVAFVFTWLAHKAIRKDEQLVRSADRIR